MSRPHAKHREGRGLWAGGSITKPAGQSGEDGKAGSAKKGRQGPRCSFCLASGGPGEQELGLVKAAKAPSVVRPGIGGGQHQRAEGVPEDAGSHLCTKPALFPLLCKIAQPLDAGQAGRSRNQNCPLLLFP